MPTFLYIIAESERGPCKIGIGGEPTGRVSSLQCGNPRTLTLHHSRQISHHLPHAVEQLAHAIAGERHRIQREWFDLPVSAAVAAVDAAIERQRSIVVSEYPVEPSRRRKAQVVMVGEKRRLKPPSALYRQRREREAGRAISVAGCSAPMAAS